MDKDLSKNLNFFREKNNLKEVIKILLVEKKKQPKKFRRTFPVSRSL